MEEMTIGSSSQSAAQGISSSATANEVRLSTGMSSGGHILEDEGTVLDSGIVPFFDTNDGSQIIFKGILDSNGSVILDPSFLMSGISIDGIVRDGNFSFATIAHPQVSSSNVPSMGAKPPEHHFDAHHLVQISDEFVVASSTQDVQHMTHSADPNRFMRDKSSSHQNVIVAISSNNSTNMSSTRDDHQTETIPVVGNGRSLLQPRHNLPIKVADDVDPPIRKGPHICSDCGKSFLKWPQFKRHKAEHLDEKSFRCSLCSMSFNFESNLTLHVMIHEAEANGSLECKMCPAKFTRMASLRSHVRVHEKEENLVCPECGDEFATKARLENHLDEHNPSHAKSLFYRCKLCGKSFNQAALLKDHSKEHVAVRNQLKILHPRRRKPAQPKATSNIFNLEQSQVTNTPLEEPEPQPLSKAKQRKDQKKKLNCSVCSKRFEKPSQLSRHMRIHTGEKPFECPHCRRSFNQKCTLESHVLSMHDKLKPFVCHLCNSSFSQRGNLKAHVLKVHVPPGNDDKYFKCEECPCVYRRIATLNAHIAKFHTKSHKKLSTTNVEFSPENVGNGDPVDDAEPAVEALSETVDVVSQEVPPVQQNNETTATQSETPTISHDPHPPATKDTELAVTSSNTSSSYNLQEQKTNDALVEEMTEVSIMHETEGSSKKVQVKVKKIGTDKWHLCPFDQCPKAFKKPSDLVRHIRVHTQERPYTCDQCGKSFAVKSTLRTHSKTHAEVKDWECRICRKQFSVLNSLKTHERLHTGAKPFHCLQCSKCFRTSSQRRMHMRVHARNAQCLMMGGRRVKLLRIGDTQPTQKVDLPDPLKITSDGDLIPVPNRTSGSMLKVTNEMMEEGSTVSSEWTKSRPYKCTQCPSAFKKSSHLKQHLRSHTGERPYKCFQCYRNFISSGVLKNHIKTHEGVRAHKCAECQLTFTTNGSLKRHMVSVHSDLRSFVCPYCHKTFKTSVQCRKHIKTHRNELLQLQSKRESAPFQAPQVSSSNNKNEAPNPQESYTSVDPAIVSKSNSEEQLPAESSVPYDVATDQGGITDQRSVVLSMSHHQSHLEEDPNLMDSRPIADTDPTTESLQIQDITELMNNGHELSSVTAGDVTQYSLQSSTLGHDGSHHRMSISLGDGQTYDGPIFALQSGDSIDLSGSLSHIMPSASLVVPTTSVLNVSDHSVVRNSEPDYATDPDKAVCDGSSQTKSLLCDQSRETKQQLQQNNQENNNISEINVNVINMGSESGIDIDSSSIVAMSIVTDVPAHDRSKVNVCSHCGRGFKKRSDLLRHFRIHTGEKPFKCHICGKAFRVKSTRESHLRTHEGGKSVSCNICNNMFSTKSSLNVHLRLHTGIKPYKCPHCDKHFRTSGHRKAHQQWHIKAAKEATKNSQDMLAPRQNQNHSLLPPVQTIRGKSSNNANLVNQVVPSSSNVKQDNHSTEEDLITGEVIVDQSSITNSGNGASICYLTSGGTDGTGLLSGTTDPVQIVGSLQLTLDSGLPNVQITGLDLNTLQLSDDFLQSLGNVIFMTQPNHSNGSSHTDPLTGTMVGQTISVLTGKDLNIGSTALVGNSNVTTFGDLESIPASNSELVHGFNAHNSPMLSSVIIDHHKHQTSADKNVGIPSNKHCSVCGKTFAKPSLLKRHMTTHTGEKPFKCKQCGCAFNQKNSLDVHMFTHGDEDERPFACSLCPFRTVLKTALRKHCLRAHKDAWNESMITPISTSKSLSVPVST